MTPSQREIWVDAPGPLARLRTRMRNSAYARLRPVRQRWTKLRGRDDVEPTGAAGPAFEVAGDFPPLAEPRGRHHAPRYPAGDRTAARNTSDRRGAAGGQNAARRPSDCRVTPSRAGHHRRHRAVRHGARHARTAAGSAVGSRRSLHRLRVGAPSAVRPSPCFCNATSGGSIGFAASSSPSRSTMRSRRSSRGAGSSCSTSAAKTR